MRVLCTLILGVVGALACKAREDAFYAKVFTCESNASGDVCGTSRQGKPMTCFGASQLGGQDFCVESCDPVQGSDQPGFVCLSSGALLQRCRPHAGADDPTVGCPAGLECYRTDLLLDQGVCVQMHVCTQDSDCGEKRPVCSARLIRERSPSFPIQADNLQCLQSMCGAGKADCPSGEYCLAGFYEGVSDYDICVATCDGSLQCPPNFACALSPNASGSPSLCLPGLPGIRCHADQDCVAGDCIDTGADFKMCVLPVPCQSNQDCAMFDGAASTFFCVEGVPGAGKRCILRETFAGTNCTDATDCPVGFMCSYVSPGQAVQGHGECRLLCADDGSCPVRGGIPHICLEGGRGGCFPIGFALPCASAADCSPELSCLAVVPDERSHISSPTICTTTCAADSDCSSNPMIRVGGFCRPDEHLCRAAGGKGDPCDRDRQCSNASCTIDANGKGKCAL